MSADGAGLAPAELLVCMTCRRAGEAPVDGERPGARLVAGLEQAGMPAGVRLRPVECLQNCENGCTVALRGGGRWTYVFGNLDEAEGVPLLREGAALYHAAPDGLIPWRSRPEHFKRNCVARIPPETFPEEDH